MRRCTIFRLAAALACLVATPVVTTAQSFLNAGDLPTVTISEASYRNLMDRVSALEASMGNSQEDSWLDTHGQKWKHKWGGRVMADNVLFAQEPAGAPQQNYFEFRRIRLFTSGTGYGIFDYKLQLDFEPENSGAQAVSMKDIWLGMDHVPVLGYVKFGHYYAPFSLEMNTSDKYITFLERTIPTEAVFAPGREVGVAAYNHTHDQNITWGYGVFFDDLSDVTKERIDDNQGTTLAGRMTWTPYYDEMSKGRFLFHTGLGIRYTDPHDNSIRFRSRPHVHEGNYFIDTGTFADASDFTVLGAELATVWGPLSLQSELMWTQTSTGDRGLGEQSLYGAYVFASYFLTGEHREYVRRYGIFGRVKPLENFWIVRGAGIGAGAVELKARWSYLDFSNVDRGTYNDITVGFNWYWTPYVQIKFDWIHPFTDDTFANADGAPADFLGDTESDIIAIRMQFDF